MAPMWNQGFGLFQMAEAGLHEAPAGSHFDLMSGPTFVSDILSYRWILRVKVVKYRIQFAFLICRLRKFIMWSSASSRRMRFSIIQSELKN